MPHFEPYCLILLICMDIFHALIHLIVEIEGVPNVSKELSPPTEQVEGIAPASVWAMGSINSSVSPAWPLWRFGRHPPLTAHGDGHQVVQLLLGKWTGLLHF